MTFTRSLFLLFVFLTLSLHGAEANFVPSSLVYADDNLYLTGTSSEPTGVIASAIRRFVYTFRDQLTNTDVMTCRDSATTISCAPPSGRLIIGSITKCTGNHGLVLGRTYDISYECRENDNNVITYQGIYASVVIPEPTPRPVIGLSDTNPYDGVSVLDSNSYSATFNVPYPGMSTNLPFAELEFIHSVTGVTTIFRTSAYNGPQAIAVLPRSYNRHKGLEAGTYFVRMRAFKNDISEYTVSNSITYTRPTFSAAAPPTFATILNGTYGFSDEPSGGVIPIFANFDNNCGIYDSRITLRDVHMNLTYHYRLNADGPEMRSFYLRIMRLGNAPLTHFLEEPVYIPYGVYEATLYCYYAPDLITSTTSPRFAIRGSFPMTVQNPEYEVNSEAAYAGRKRLVTPDEAVPGVTADGKVFFISQNKFTLAPLEGGDTDLFPIPSDPMRGWLHLSSGPKGAIRVVYSNAALRFYHIRYNGSDFVIDESSEAKLFAIGVYTFGSSKYNTRCMISSTHACVYYLDFFGGYTYYGCHPLREDGSIDASTNSTGALDGAPFAQNTPLLIRDTLVGLGTYYDGKPAVTIVKLGQASRDVITVPANDSSSLVGARCVPSVDSVTCTSITKRGIYVTLVDVPTGDVSGPIVATSSTVDVNYPANSFGTFVGRWTDDPLYLGMDSQIISPYGRGGKMTFAVSPIGTSFVANQGLDGIILSYTHGDAIYIFVSTSYYGVNYVKFLQNPSPNLVTPMCTNHGTISGDICECDPGFTNEICSWMISDCTVNGGVQNGPNSCTCANGLVGEECNVAQECAASGVGLGEGGLFDPSNPYCICRSYASGPRCGITVSFAMGIMCTTQNATDPCSCEFRDTLSSCSFRQPCEHGVFHERAYVNGTGVSVVVDDYFVSGHCVCEPNYSGVRCTTITAVCSGHGERQDGVCVCEDMYDGTNCEYGPIDCGTHGTQVNATCICASGYYGNRCQYAHQTCVYGTEVNGTCVCNDGYYGTMCDHVVLNCGSHGVWQGTACVCDSGYGGSTCAVPMPACNGRGSPSVSGCTCSQPYYGTFCEHLQPDCNSHGYANGSTCVCLTGFNGPYCDVPDSLCHEFYCEGIELCPMSKITDTSCSTKFVDSTEFGYVMALAGVGTIFIGFVTYLGMRLYRMHINRTKADPAYAKI